MCKIKWNDGIVHLSSFIEDNGVLCPIEFDILPFIPKRIFYVTNVIRRDIRGQHAHFETEQVLICLQGQILVRTIDKNGTKTHMLYPTDAIYIPKMVWDEQEYCTGNDILLSICSTKYDKNDYINTIEELWSIK